MISKLSMMVNKLCSFFLPYLAQEYVSGGSSGGDGLSDQANLLNEGNITSFASFASGLQKALRDIVGPILIAIGAVAAIFVIYLGVQYAKAEDANKRKEVQGRLIGCSIGLIIMLVGVALCYSINWVEVYANVTGHRHNFEADEVYPQFCKWCAQKAGSVVHS